MTTYGDYFGVLTYVDPLIFNKAEYYEAWQHREVGVRCDILLHKYICTLDHDILQELPVFVPDILGSDKSTEQQPEEEEGALPTEPNKPKPINGNALTTEEPKKSEKDDQILQDWIHEKWTDLLIRMFDAARTHKWCIVQLYNAPPYWRVFTYREVMSIKYNGKDEPISAKVLWAKRLPLASTAIVHEEELNFLQEKALEVNEKGESISKAIMVNFASDLDEKIDSTDIENIWTLDIYLRYIMLDIINNSAKSSGFYWVKYGSHVDDSKKADIEALFEKACSSRAVGATENLIADVKAMYMTNPEFPVEAFDKLLKVFSGACGMPLLYFNGEKETGSIFEENSGAMAQVNKKKQEIFGRFKQSILSLVEMRWGVRCEDVFPNIEETEDDNYSEDIIEPRTEGSDNTSKEVKKMRLQSK